MEKSTKMAVGVGVAALALTWLAVRFARKKKNDAAFAVGVLASGATLASVGMFANSVRKRRNETNRIEKYTDSNVKTPWFHVGKNMGEEKNIPWKHFSNWDSEKEIDFRLRFVENAKKIVKSAQESKDTIDCADVALSAFIETAAEMGFVVVFEIYAGSGYKKISSHGGAFLSKNQFLGWCKKNMGAINLLDWKTTKDIVTPAAGDLVMFDLRDETPDLNAYQGHTVIVLEDVDDNKVLTAQGHLSGSPSIEEYGLGDKMYGAMPQYKRFRYDKILK